MKTITLAITYDARNDDEAKDAAHYLAEIVMNDEATHDVEVTIEDKAEEATS